MGDTYAATGKFTSFDATQLMAAMNAVQGTSVVATVNENGTANAAIFVPMMPDEGHVVLTLAQNRTRQNIERTGECVVVFDQVDPSASEKSERHKGARLRLVLVGKESDEYQQVANEWPHMNPYTLVFRISESMPIG